MKQLQLYTYVNTEHPMVAWEVYSARLFSADATAEDGFQPLSLRYAAVLKDSTPNRLSAEIRIEHVRRKYYPKQVSRLTGLYFFESRKAAETAQQEWGVRHFNAANLIEVGVTAETITKVDSEWITHCFFDQDQKWMRSYWQGDTYGKTPLWEILVSGAGIVWGTSTRERAYEVVRSQFPKSLGMLELSRVAFDCGFNLGRIVPYIIHSGDNRFRLNFAMDFRDADNPEFLQALSGYQGPRNVRDMNPLELVPPDLRPYMFDFTLDAGIFHPFASTTVPDHGSIEHFRETASNQRLDATGNKENTGSILYL